ncbi:unnamed protein product [Polarella glacialis]|uniref:Smr domain-containing protein n=2 Tax=Polarella glacialis TaxID=89957 RepID=A0A813I5D7_POLGL|nr:unnamed protein product [Polarella glacialis]CAE8644982.1 unnamed protein product [Polarella glacialis]
MRPPPPPPWLAPAKRLRLEVRPAAPLQPRSPQSDAQRAEDNCAAVPGRTELLPTEASRSKHRPAKDGAKASSSRFDQGDKLRWKLLSQLKEGFPTTEATLEAINKLHTQKLLVGVRDYTAVISALGRCGQWQKAAVLYEELAASAEASQAPDEICHAATVSACERASQWTCALDLLRARRSLGFNSGIAAYGAAISACGKSQQWEHAVACLSALREQGVVPNATCFGIAVSACGRGSQPGIALALLKQAHSVGVEPGLLGYSAALSACARSQQWQPAMDLLAAMQDRQLEPDAVCLSSAFGALGAVGNWPLVLQLLREAQLRSARNAGQLTSGSDRGKHTKAHAGSLDVVAFNSALSAFERVSQWQRAVALLAELLPPKKPSQGVAGSIRPDLVSFNVAISAWGQGRHWVEALHTLALAHGAQLKPDVVSFAAAISACERAGRWQPAVALLGSMRSRALRPNALCYGAALGAGDWRLALWLLREMQIDGLTPTTVCCNTAITACGREHQWQMGLRLFHDMIRLQVKPSVVSYNAAISSCEKGSDWQRSISLLHEARRAGLEPTVVSFGAAAAACRRGAEWRWALQVVEEMRQGHLEPDPECLRVVLLAMCEAGVGTEALGLLRSVAFEDGASDGVSGGLLRAWPSADGSGQKLLDLHELPVEVAMLAARAVFDDIARSGHGPDVDEELIIVVGRGKHSDRGEALLRPALLAMLRELGLQGRLAPGNSGRVLVPIQALRRPGHQRQ